MRKEVTPVEIKDCEIEAQPPEIEAQPPEIELEPLEIPTLTGGIPGGP
jgi:hypothetical protein